MTPSTPRKSALALCAVTALLALASCQTYTPSEGQTLPSPRYLEHPPQYIPPSPSFPLTRELAAQERAAPAPPPPAMRTPGHPAGAVPAPMAPDGRPTVNAPSAPPVAAGAAVGGMAGAAIGSLVGGGPPAMSTPPAPPSMVVPGKKAKLTVANVRGVGAQLFTVSADGELAYVDSVAAGDAIDVETTTGTRWAAVFSERPHSQSFQVTAEQGIWLLRAARPAPPTTVGSRMTSSNHMR
jgi:hypothetical protein